MTTPADRAALIEQLAAALQTPEGDEECVDDALGNVVCELLGLLAHDTAFDGPFRDGAFASAYEARGRQLAGQLRQTLTEPFGVDAEDTAVELASGIENDDQLVSTVDGLLRAYGKAREPRARAFLFRRMAGAFGEPRSLDPKEVAEDAGLAFWRLVADTFPTATSGDVAPEVSIRFSDASEEAVASWITWSVPSDDD